MSDLSGGRCPFSHILGDTGPEEQASSWFLYVPFPDQQPWDFFKQKPEGRKEGMNHVDIKKRMSQGKKAMYAKVLSKSLPDIQLNLVFMPLCGCLLPPS